MGQKYDFFDCRGLREAYEEIERFFDILGAPSQNRKLFIGPGKHGYSAHNQKEMVAFFCHHAQLDPPPRPRKIERLPARQLNVTTTGNVGDSGCKAGYELIAIRADDLQRKRKRLPASALIRRLAALLDLPPRPHPPHYRNLRPSKLHDRVFSRYAIDTEASVRAILYRKPVNWLTARTLVVDAEIHLYLPHTSALEGLISDPFGRSLARKYSVYALDVRGLGESRPDEELEFFDPYGLDYMMNGHGLLLGESYLGRRVHDLLSTLDLLVSEGARRVHLYGRGQGSLVALFAGVLHPSVRTVTLKNSPLSYQQWTQVPVVTWPAANTLRGVLKHFDIPDCIRLLGRKVRLIQPWGPEMQPVAKRRAEKLLTELSLPTDLLGQSAL